MWSKIQTFHVIPWELLCEIPRANFVKLSKGASDRNFWQSSSSCKLSNYQSLLKKKLIFLGLLGDFDGLC